MSTVQYLPVKLTEAEVIVRAREMAGSVKQLRDLEDEKKETAKDYKDRIDALRAAIEDIAEVVATGYEKRPVDIERIPDFAKGVARIVRQDTGETLQEVELSEEDRQATLPN